MIQKNETLPVAATLLARTTSVATLGLCAALLGCSDDSINMGEGVPTPVEPSPPALSSRCSENPVLEGDVVVHNQAEVDDLEGCELIDGNLSVAAFAGADLRALHALTTVSGRLTIGGTQEDFAEEPDEAARQRLTEEGWLSSLEGLEGLESAGSLSLNGIEAEDLKPLSSLRTLRDGLSIGHTENLTSLDGLQNLAGLRSLDITGRRLASFDGLTLPEDMISLRVYGVDLRQLKPIGVRYIQSLSLDHTRLHDLTAFADLRYADNIFISANFELESLAGLENLEVVQDLDLDFNRALREVPDFQYLSSWLQVLRITGSPLLTRLPAFQGLQRVINDNPSPETSVRFRPVIEIVELGMTTFSLPAGWLSAAFVRISHNANLTHIDFTGQTYIDYLQLQENPLLETVGTGVLDKINVIDAFNNPRLSMSEFAGVRGFDVTGSGNAP